MSKSLEDDFDLFQTCHLYLKVQVSCQTSVNKNRNLNNEAKLF